MANSITLGQVAATNHPTNCSYIYNLTILFMGVTNDKNEFSSQLLYIILYNYNFEINKFSADIYY